MCSGYGMLQKKRTPKSIIISILQILIVYTSWMLIYGIIDSIKLLIHGYNLKIAFNGLIKCVIFGHYHVWFLFTLIGLYLATPIFYELMQSFTTATYTVVLTIIATIVFPLIKQLSFWERFEYTLSALDINYFYGYICFYLLGFYLATYIKLNKKLVYIIFIIIFSLTSIISYNSDISGQAVQGAYMDEFGLLGFSLNLFLFLCFKDITINHKLSGIIQTTVQYGFPIYLMHPLFLNFTSNLDGFLSGVRAILIYTICIIISIYLNKSTLTRIFFITGKVFKTNKKA